MVEQSYLVANKEGVVTSYIGPDATHLFRVKMLRHALKGWLKFKMLPTRGVNMTKMLKMAEEYTGNKYKRTEVQYAIEDLDVWISTMVAAMPVEGV